MNEAAAVLEKDDWELERYVAALFDRVGSMAAVARLTRRIIFDVLFRNFDRESTAERSDPPDAIADDLPQMEKDRIFLFEMGASLNIKHEKLVAEWRKKYGDAPYERKK